MKLPQNHTTIRKTNYRLWEWRYALFVKKDYSVAENYFQEAKIFARMIDNSHLIEQLEKQWQHDLQDFLKINIRK